MTLTFASPLVPNWNIPLFGANFILVLTGTIMCVSIYVTNRARLFPGTILTGAFIGNRRGRLTFCKEPTNNTLARIDSCEETREMKINFLKEFTLQSKKSSHSVQNLSQAYVVVIFFLHRTEIVLKFIISLADSVCLCSQK